MGVTHLPLKTGAIGRCDLARLVKYASDAKIDLLTVDGAGRHRDEPWRMMNEWGIPYGLPGKPPLSIFKAARETKGLYSLLRHGRWSFP
jgi:hypothetical protein